MTQTSLAIRRALPVNHFRGEREMAHEEMTLQKMGITSIRVRRIHRTEAIGDEDTTTLLQRHQRGDWGETSVKAPGENEYSIRNFHLTSYVVSEYSEEPEDQSIMIFTALYTGRTVIFRRGELSLEFMAEHLREMFDLAGGD
jgi:hypothetical protein